MRTFNDMQRVRAAPASPITSASRRTSLDSVDAGNPHEWRTEHKYLSEGICIDNPMTSQCLQLDCRSTIRVFNS
jgi:hypothetical protein